MRNLLYFKILTFSGYVSQNSRTATAGQMFAFYAVVLPAALVWKARHQHPNLPYRVPGGSGFLLFVSILGIIIVSIPFLIKLGVLPEVVG